MYTMVVSSGFQWLSSVLEGDLYMVRYFWYKNSSWYKNIAHGSVCDTIVHQHLRILKLPTRSVPRGLLDVQHRFQSLHLGWERLGIYNDNHESCHVHLVTGFETWIHYWDQETIQDIAPWVTELQKMKTKSSARTVMTTVF